MDSWSLDTLAGLEQLWRGQLVLLLLALALSAAPLARAIRDAGPGAALVALALPAALLSLLAPEQQLLFGHERVLGSMLAGMMPPLADAETHSMGPLAQAAAWALAPGAGVDEGTPVLRWINRLSLGLAALAAGALAVPEGAGRSRRWLAGTLGAASLVVTVPLLAWSATYFFVAPAAALGLAALLLAQRGHRGRGLLLLAAAIGLRVEWLGVALAAWVGGPAEPDRAVRSGRALAGALVGVGAVAVQLVVLRARPGGEALGQRLEGGAALGQALEVAPLAGAWLTPLALGVAVALLGLASRTSRPRRLACVVVGGLAAALISGFAWDVAARHFVPVGILAGVVVAGSVAALPRAWPLLGLVVLPLVGPPTFASWTLHEARWMKATPPEPTAWVEAAGDRTWTREELAGEPCVYVTDGLSVRIPGDINADPVGLDRVLADELGAEVCIVWVFGMGDAFHGDARAERADRARRLLGLSPDGWLAAEGNDRRMLLFRRTPDASGVVPDRRALLRLHERAW